MVQHNLFLWIVCPSNHGRLQGRNLSIGDTGVMLCLQHIGGRVTYDTDNIQPHMLRSQSLSPHMLRSCCYYYLLSMDKNKSAQKGKRAKRKLTLNHSCPHSCNQDPRYEDTPNADRVVQDKSSPRDWPRFQDTGAGWWGSDVKRKFSVGSRSHL